MKNNNYKQLPKLLKTLTIVLYVCSAFLLYLGINSLFLIWFFNTYKSGSSFKTAPFSDLYLSAALFVGLAIIFIVTATSFLKRKRWGWYLGIASGIFALPFFPAGTIVGIFTLVAVLRHESKQWLFIKGDSEKKEPKATVGGAMRNQEIPRDSVTATPQMPKLINVVRIILYVFAGPLCVVVFYGVYFVTSYAGNSDATGSMDILGIGILALLFGAPALAASFFAARGIERRKLWARVLATLVFAFMFLLLPIGTIIGALVIVYLYSKESNDWFHKA